MENIDNNNDEEEDEKREKEENISIINIKDIGEKKKWKNEKIKKNHWLSLFLGIILSDLFSKKNNQTFENILRIFYENINFSKNVIKLTIIIININNEDLAQINKNISVKELFIPEKQDEERLKIKGNKNKNLIYEDNNTPRFQDETESYMLIKNLML